MCEARPYVEENSLFHPRHVPTPLQEYMRFFLPKTADGELLSLRCSEAEFSAHTGTGESRQTLGALVYLGSSSLSTLGTLTWWASRFCGERDAQSPWGVSNTVGIHEAGTVNARYSRQAYA
eukprot:6201163-Pleurochrysis_carterae.AAC.2